jgi:hypothetical protein
MIRKIAGIQQLRIREAADVATSHLPVDYDHRVPGFGGALPSPSICG